MADKVTYNAFLSSYWLGKEEVANKKILSLIELENHVGVMEMEIQVNEVSERCASSLVSLSRRNQFKGSRMPSGLVSLVNEVTDCATLEQMLIYIGYVDEEGKTHFDFLEVKDVLETSESAKHLHQTCTWKHQIQNFWNPVLLWPCFWVANSHSAWWGLMLLWNRSLKTMAR